MLLTGIVVGLLLGLALGGRISALVNVRLRYAALLFAAIFLRYGTQILISQGVVLADMLRVPLYALAFGTLIAALWLNRRSPGLLLVLVGVAFNATAILVNGGSMPVSLAAVDAAGLSPAELNPTYHVILPADLGTDFLRMAGPLGDIVPFPVPVLPNVVSLGDVLISIGLGWFVFATLRWGDPEPEESGVTLWSGRSRPTPGPGAMAQRPVILGTGVGPGQGPAPDSVAGRSVPWSVAPADDAALSASGTAQATAATAAAAARPSLRARVRTHPYVRLARDARFSAFWLGQTISAFGDKLNQIALALWVVERTGSALLSGLVFVAAMLPNLLAPVAGTLVDRWDQKRVMIAADVVRAALVIAMPFALADNIAWAYPIVFLITAASLFFRPARAAVLPRMVREEDLLSANGAMWTGETLMEVAGYPLAAALIVGVGFTAAFFIDGMTYVVSALLIAGIAIPPVVRTVGPRAENALRAFADELAEGWRFLRSSPPLFQNTLVSILAQLSVGATIALTAFYVTALLGPGATEADESAVLGGIEGAIGLGNLIGGFIVGLVGVRLRKGRMVVLGFVLMGLGTIAWGLAPSPAVAIGAAFAVGVFNLVWLVPSQTLFGELVPRELMGRVISIRGALVFGTMTLSMGVSSALAETIPVGGVFVLLGGVTVLAGVIGAFLPAVRDT
jgi:MFS family permease